MISSTEIEGPDANPGRGHGVLMEIPGVVGARIMGFVRRHDRAAARA
ncbi:hypothetical protein ACWDOP_09910 [Nocardia sp. NPDC003693]